MAFDDVNELINELLGHQVNSEDSPQKEKTERGVEGNYQAPFQYSEIIGHFAPGMSSKSHPTGHFGTDFRGEKGESVYPFGPGVVIRTGDGPRSGLFVTISHEDGKVISFYGHLDSVNVSQGDEVDFNTTIGAVGRTGNASKLNTAHHVHAEVAINGKKVDPLSIIGKPFGSFSKKAQLENAINNILNKFAKTN
jgi:murein DD-endopeptidase MepM/ murein hydrolase activator NlpD